MAVMRPVVLTSEGRRALEEQLQGLYKRRSDVVEEIAASRDETDLAESTAYLQAREEQSLVEARILEIETILRGAGEAESGGSDVARVGSPGGGVGGGVVVADGGDETEFYLVDPYAVDPPLGRISTESPVGRALVGARGGDVVTAQTPTGPRRLAVRRVG